MQPDHPSPRGVTAPLSDPLIKGGESPPRIDSLERGTTNSRPSLAVRTEGLSMFMPPRTLPGGRDADRKGASAQSASGREIRTIAWRLMSKTHASPSHPPVTKAEDMGNSSGPPPDRP